MSGPAPGQDLAKGDGSAGVRQSPLEGTPQERDTAKNIPKNFLQMKSFIG
jgi:hypothetical protein